MSHEPILINHTIWNVLSSLNIKEDVCAHLISKSWEKVLGGALAQNAQFDHYQNGNLYIYVPNIQWRKECQTLTGALKDKFNELLGIGAVQNIYISSSHYQNKD